MATKDYSGKIAYIYDEDTSTWYAVSGAINTAASYNWIGTNTYENTVIFEDSIKSKTGINNFLNPSARDLAIAAPTNGAIAFVRQDSSGNVINQLQYFYNGSWRQVFDTIDIVSSPTNYTLSLSDVNKLISQTGSAENTVTIPRSTSVNFLIGQRIEIVQYGTGQTTVAPDTGVIINSLGSNKKLSGQYATAKLVKIDTDTWLLSGDLAS